MSAPGRFQFTQKLFLRKGNRLLVLRDALSGKGDLPGGRVAEDEMYMLETAMLRELAEELGDSVKVEIQRRPLLVFPVTTLSGEIGVIGVGYEAELIAGEVQLSAEHDLMEWVDVFTYEPEAHYDGSGLLQAVRAYLEYVRKG